jgi:hypothetical protein
VGKPAEYFRNFWMTTEITNGVARFLLVHQTEHDEHDRHTKRKQQAWPIGCPRTARSRSHHGYSLQPL